MRYALAFGILGSCLVVLAVQAIFAPPGYLVWAIAGIEGYLALSLFTLALFYALHDRGFAVARFSEHRIGKWVFSLLLFPYRRLARIVIAIARRFDPMELMNPIGSRVYVGRLPSPSDRKRLAEAGVTSVLNLCVEFPVGTRHVDTSINTVYLPLLDGVAPSVVQFQRALDWIAERHAEGETILIHCAQGRGRSVTVAAAALCRLGLAIDPEAALAAIKAARPKARPSIQQRNALKRFCAPSAPATSTR